MVGESNLVEGHARSHRGGMRGRPRAEGGGKRGETREPSKYETREFTGDNKLKRGNVNVKQLLYILANANLACHVSVLSSGTPLRSAFNSIERLTWSR